MRTVPTATIIVPVKTKAYRARITVPILVTIRRKALRKRAWFKVLNRTERAIISLTIRCVDKIRSPKLIEILSNIAIKLLFATESPIEALMVRFGRSLAFKLSLIARSLGVPQAFKWKSDPSFIQYLTVMFINTPVAFSR